MCETKASMMFSHLSLMLKCFWQLTDVCFGSMFINLYESLLKGKPVYTLIFIHIYEAMPTELTGQFSLISPIKF